MKRRSFIKRAIPVVTVPFLMNGLPVRAFGKGSMFEKLLRSATISDRVLVIIQLNGGNDGLNTVIPLDKYSALSNSRSNILIPSNLVLSLNGTTTTGLHPSMTGMRNLFNDGKVNVVQGVSYPNPNYSHFRATDIWLSASDSDENITSGWMGRYLNEEYTGYPDDFPNDDHPDPLALQVGSTVSGGFQGPAVNMGIAIANLNDFYKLTTDNYGPEPDTPAGHELAFIRKTSIQTNAYADRLKEAAKQTTQSTMYPPDSDKNNLADQLKVVARLIGGGLQTKVYMVTLGGFDTHSAQAVSGSPQTGDHAKLLEKLSKAITAFQDDIEKMGQQDRVLGMTFSEFGRRIKSNNALGTDHGSSAPMFLFGKKVKSGFIGTNPVIPNNAGVNDNLEMQYDFRSVYTSILKNWFCVPDDVLNTTMLQSFSTLDLLSTSCNPDSVPGESIENTSLRNYPNPANSSTVIEFQTTGGNLQMKLYDEVGKEIETIVDGTYAPGSYQVEVDTHKLARGVYFYTLRQGEKRYTKRMMLM